MMGALLSLLQLIPTYNDGLYMIDIHKTVHDSIMVRADTDLIPNFLEYSFDVLSQLSIRYIGGQQFLY